MAAQFTLTKAPRGTLRPSVDRTSDQFFARPGFAGDQNSGVGGSDLGYTREHRSQGRRSADDLLEHRCLIDFFAQRDVLVLESLFSLLAILDIGPSNIPTRDASLFIPYRVIAEKKPAILPAVSP